jgi:uncharacterized membrane protein YjdF
MVDIKDSQRLMISVLIPAFIVLALVATSLIRSQFPENVYWIAMALLIMALVVWKYVVRRCLLSNIDSRLNDSSVAKLRPYAYAFMAVFFGSATAFLAYVSAVWYFQFHVNGTILVAFFSLWFIKIEVWGLIIRSVMQDTDATKPGFNSN